MSYKCEYERSKLPFFFFLLIDYTDPKSQVGVDGITVADRLD